MLPWRKTWTKQRFYHSIGKDPGAKNDLSLLLEELSYQAGCIAGDQFFKGAISDKHQCVSQDGERYSELFALVCWNGKNWPVGAWSLGTYRFDLNEMTFTVNHDLDSDIIRYDGLYIHKKDGFFLVTDPCALPVPQETATKSF